MIDRLVRWDCRRRTSRRRRTEALKEVDVDAVDQRRQPLAWCIIPADRAATRTMRAGEEIFFFFLKKKKNLLFALSEIYVMDVGGR